jgi:hypothetical protein
MKKAKVATQTRFWIDWSGRIRVAPLPDVSMPTFKRADGTPFFRQEIICQNALEADLWSAKLRQQEKDEFEQTEEQVEQREGPVRDWLRKQMLTHMAQAPNQVTRDFILRAIERLDKLEARKKARKIESYMHQEAAEMGH